MRTFVETIEKDGLSRKKARTAADPQLDRHVLNFFVENRDKGVCLDGPQILGQAEKINRHLYQEEEDDDESHSQYTVSRGWLDRWKKRHGVHQVKRCGESKSSDLQAATDFIPEFQKFVLEEDLSLDQIYNCDETGLSHKIMPERTLAFKDDPHAKEGFKVIKDRVTILFACNWSGNHKLKPLAIGRFQNPRCFHHINKKTLSVIYRHSKNAWMTRDLFSEWFHCEFVPKVRMHLRRQGLEEKAVLLLDNCPAHPHASKLVSMDGKIKVFYLPKNTTAKIQPLDQGIIACFKKHYRHHLVRAAVDSPLDVPQFLKGTNLKDAFHFTGLAWAKVTKQTINHCWNHALGGPPQTETEAPAEEPVMSDSDDDDEFQLEFHMTLRQLMDDWRLLPVAADPLYEPEDQEEEEEEEQPELEPQPDPQPEPQPQPDVTAEEALAGLEKAMNFFNGKGKDTVPNVPIKILRLKSMIYDLKQVYHSGQKQASIKDFFTMN